MLRHGYTSPREITDADLRAVPDRLYRGMDALDAALCEAGVLRRSPQRGSQRRLRRRRLTPAELVAGSQIPERFREVHERYLEAISSASVVINVRRWQDAMAALDSAPDDPATQRVTAPAA